MCRDFGFWGREWVRSTVSEGEENTFGIYRWGEEEEECGMKLWREMGVIYLEFYVGKDILVYILKIFFKLFYEKGLEKLEER